MTLLEELRRALEHTAEAAARGHYDAGRGYLRAADKILAELSADPPTSPATPTAKRRSSDQLAAVRLPEPGLDERVSAELAKGKA